MRLNIIQDTEAWYALKQNKIGASESGVIMGLSRYQTPFQLWEQKLTRTLIPSNKAMEEGKRLEPLARMRLEEKFRMPLEAPVYQHVRIPYMIASLDAYNAKEGVLIEIKCGSKSYSLAQQQIIPDYYFAQCQHQMEVVGLDKMKYHCWLEGEEGITIDVYRDSAYINRLLDAEKEFWECLQNFVPPKLADKDYEQMTSTEWKDCAKDLLQVQEQLSKLQDEERKLRDDLIRQANNRNCEGAGIKVTKVISKGHVQYNQIPELKGVDLDKFRKEPSTTYRLTKVK